MMTKALGLILLFGILTVAVIPALGQDQPTKGTATNTSTANTPTAKASPNPCDAVNKGGSPLEDKDQGKVIGVVSAPSADASSTATLTLEGQGDNGNRYVVSQQNFQPCGASATANTERFAYEQVVDPGTYDAILTSPDYATQTTTVPVPKGKTVRKDFNFPKAAISTNIWLVLVPIIFLLSIWFVRWNNIAVPTRRELQAQVKETLAQVQDSPQKKSGVIDELATVEKQLEERKSVFWDWILWSRGLELAGWKAIHNAQIALIDDASPERVDARLLSAEQELVQSGKPSASGLALRIKSQFDNPANSTRETRKQLLKEALSYLNSYAETDFGGLTSWQNKAFWLTSVGVLLIVALTVTEKHGSLFMAGAAGGFLSRMMRQLKRADVPSDYGASWATLFLSPISGALAGWFGVLLIMLLADPKVGSSRARCKLSTGIHRTWRPSWGWVSHLVSPNGFSMESCRNWKLPSTRRRKLPKKESPQLRSQQEQEQNRALRSMAPSRRLAGQRPSHFQASIFPTLRRWSWRLFPEPRSTRWRTW